MTQLGMPVPQPGEFVRKGEQTPSVAVEERPQNSPKSEQAAQKMVSSSTLVISPEELEQQYAQWHREMGTDAQDAQPAHDFGSDAPVVKDVNISDGPTLGESGTKPLTLMGEDEQPAPQSTESAQSSWSDDKDRISVPSASKASSWSDVDAHSTESEQFSATNLDAGYSVEWGALDADITEHIRRPPSQDNGA